MQPYQEEYIANLRQIAALTQRETPGQTSFEAYCAQLHKIGVLVEQIAKRSMELLRGHLRSEEHTSELQTPRLIS